MFDPVDGTVHVEGEAVFVKFNWKKFNENLSTPALPPQLDIGSQEEPFSFGNSSEGSQPVLKSKL